MTEEQEEARDAEGEDQISAENIEAARFPKLISYSRFERHIFLSQISLRFFECRVL